MSRQDAAQRMTALAEATVPILRWLRGDGDVDSAALLKELDELGEAYRLALAAGVRVAYESAAWEIGREARPCGVGENGR